MYVETECCMQLEMRLLYIVCCCTDRPEYIPENSETPLHMPLVQISQVKYVAGSTLFHFWELVQTLQKESIFCSKVRDHLEYTAQEIRISSHTGREGKG